MVNLIFVRFQAIYGHKFESMFASNQAVSLAKREWAMSIGGISEALLVKAIDHCKINMSWMPTIAEFLKVVGMLDKGVNYPDVQRAYEEACRYAEHPREHAWSNPVVYHAGKASDWYRLRREDSRIMLRIFTQHYESLCARAVAGEDFTVPKAVALPDHRPDTLFQFMAAWGELNNLTPEQSHTLLFYLTKPADSSARRSLQNHARKLLESWGREEISLPDSPIL
ncbi:replication protein P [Pokkaliibacter sp. CJK22405]|uniref:replication protein P n=1 Tax=Pokkaliibacter sp. CJK22405 TaxID=3384615 RepID=UPI003984A24C